MKKSWRGLLSLVLALALVLPLGLSAHAEEVPDKERVITAPGLKEGSISVPFYGSFEDLNKNDYMNKVNGYRKEAIEKGIVEGNYQALKWSSQLEEAARIRAAEITLSYDHKRPNGEEFSSVLEGINAENISNADSLKLALDAFYGEKEAYEKKDGSKSTARYSNMVDPQLKSFAFARFQRSDGKSGVVMVFSTKESTNEGQAYNSMGSYQVNIPVAGAKATNPEFDKSKIVVSAGTEPIFPEFAWVTYTGDLFPNKTYKVLMAIEWEKFDAYKNNAGYQGRIMGKVAGMDVSLPVEVRPAKLENFILPDLIVVTKGTKLGDLNLPKEIRVKFSNKTEKTLPVEWNLKDYREPRHLPAQRSIQGQIKWNGTAYSVQAKALILPEVPDSVKVVVKEGTNYVEPTGRIRLYKGEKLNTQDRYLLTSFPSEENKDQALAINSQWITGYDPQKLGDQDLVVELMGKKAVLKIQVVEGPKVDRIGGSTRYTTAIEASKRFFPSGADTVLLARGSDFADALTAAPLAKALKSPILLADGKEVSKDLQNELERLEPKNIILIGGKLAVSSEIEEALSKMDGVEVTRLFGENRFETSAKIAKAVKALNDKDQVKTEKALLASGMVAADALSASPYAAYNRMPILLTRKDNLPKEVSKVMKDLKLQSIELLGGDVAIDNKVQAEVGKTVTKMERIYGETRFETSIKIAEKFTERDSQTVFLATGMNFADALVFGAIAGEIKAPMILTRPESLPDLAKDYLTLVHPSLTYVAGLDSAVHQSVEKELGHFDKLEVPDPSGENQ
ncbi:cell wall-binding repeat-containing protein [Kallipyga massiliensis]|uniref:cell wall-binding repeat-containing protein n=1 Tax=Kallipyga massiliensis TaxID=1472764 RepID=UPI0026F20AB3|nr:cell wall-binding repeat-containing protein [Kallipyga massiliensis]